MKRCDHSRDAMRQTHHVIGIAVLVSVSVGVFLLAAQGGSWTALAHAVTTGTGALEFLTILMVVIVPASLPMTLLGGYLAARALARQPTRRPLRFWAIRGCALGFLLGAIGSGAWFGAINAGEAGVLSFLLMMALVGGVAGSLVGSIVGAYCWRASGSPARVTRHT
jgi:hypothetical protein